MLAFIFVNGALMFVGLCLYLSCLVCNSAVTCTVRGQQEVTAPLCQSYCTPVLKLLHPVPKLTELDIILNYICTNQLFGGAPACVDHGHISADFCVTCMVHQNMTGSTSRYVVFIGIRE